MGIWNKQDRLNKKLREAILRGSFSQVQKLVDEGASVEDAPGEGKYRPLARAVNENITDIARFLLSRGAEPNGDNSGVTSYTVVTRALSHKNREMARMLIEAHADIMRPDGDGKSPVHYAAEHGFGDILQLLAEKGADLNARNSQGNTPLHIVAQAGHANIARLLMDHGADAKITNASMNTPADVAEKDYPRLADMIRGVPPRAEPEAGWQMLADDEVARVTEKPGINYRLTETFNFTTRLYTHIAQNTKTNAESHSIKLFDELRDSPALDAARNALAALGGKPADTGLQKRALPAPGTSP
ncbi:MAG: ankyrin repeat domain-containing protein [Alphaproteobacteria bacterium]|nr:ankyrin repeat domain-containing protein [Alphaproteobacteria bacterium]